MQKNRQLIFTAIMGAVAYALMWFEFPILFTLPFLKIDFSDLPILITTFIVGPMGGFFAMLIRGVIHYMQTGGDAGYPIGDLASLAASLAFIFPIYYRFRHNDGKCSSSLDKKYYSRTIVTTYLLATLSLTLVMAFLNYTVITPFYIKVMNFPIPNMAEYILLGIMPFNLIKGLILSFSSHICMIKVLPFARKKF